MHGLCHFEIPCKDPERVSKFYADVFGWGIQPIPEMDYVMFKPGDGPGGSFDKELEIADKSGITLYIEVEEINDTLEKVGASGGKVLKPKYQLSGVGYLAYFADSEGNRMGLWSK